MKHTLTLLTTLLLVPLASLHAANAPKSPAAAESDARLHADGKGWRLDMARVTDLKRPRVLLIGDSILNGYFRQVTKALDGKAYVDVWVNPYCQSEHLNNTLLPQVLVHGPYDVVHFNMGLHGWPKGRIKDGTFEPLTKSYVEALRAKLPKARLIWASSTPVTKEKQPTELEPDINPIIIEHNRMAAKVMAEMNVPVNDFYSLLVNKRELARGDRFHWTAPAYELLAKTVVESVLRELEKTKATDPSAATLLCGGSQTAEPSLLPSDPPLRREFIEAARPAIRRLLADTEKRIGLRMNFSALPATDSVMARCTYNPFGNEPRIQLRHGWQDVDVAHELMHMRMELLEGFSMLGWRRDVAHTEAVEAAFARVQTYVNDEVVHRHLVNAGLKLDGEVLRPPLFDDIYANVARYLEEGRARPADGMAHLDKLGHGALCRAAFMVQAELVLKNYRQRLSPQRVQQAERFIRAFRAHRPEETAKTDAVLALFYQYDVQKPPGQREILRRWADLEGLDKFVGVSAYKKTSRGNYILPFPSDSQ